MFNTLLVQPFHLLRVPGNRGGKLVDARHYLGDHLCGRAEMLPRQILGGLCAVHFLRGLHVETTLVFSVIGTDLHLLALLIRRLDALQTFRSDRNKVETSTLGAFI